MSNDKKTAEELLLSIISAHTFTVDRINFPEGNWSKVLSAMQQFSVQENASITARYERMVKRCELQNEYLQWYQSFDDAIYNDDKNNIDELAIIRQHLNDLKQALNEFNKEEGNK